MGVVTVRAKHISVALRKESVDRNLGDRTVHQVNQQSLSARRAWIEMVWGFSDVHPSERRSPQGERG